MKRHPFALCVLLLAPAISAAQEPRYTIQDLGTLGGDTTPSDVNAAGWVVGASGVSAFAGRS